MSGPTTLSTRASIGACPAGVKVSRPFERGQNQVLAHVLAVGRWQSKPDCQSEGARKPFNMGELLARIRVALRHRGTSVLPAARLHEHEDLRIALETRSVTAHGDPSGTVCAGPSAVAEVPRAFWRASPAERRASLARWSCRRNAGGIHERCLFRSRTAPHGWVGCARPSKSRSIPPSRPTNHQTRTSSARQTSHADAGDPWPRPVCRHTALRVPGLAVPAPR